MNAASRTRKPTIASKHLLRYIGDVDETRDRILDAAYAVFSEQGFRGATTRRIAEDAGVNEVTLFRHFAGKEELLAVAIERQSERGMAALARYPLPATPHRLHQELHDFLMATLAGFLSARQAIRTTIGEWGHHPPLNAPLMRTTEHVYDALRAYVVAAQAAGLVRPDLEPGVVTEIILATIFSDGLLRDMLPGRFPLDPAASVSAYLDVILTGLVPDPKEVRKA